jgi:hypothetical protein
VTDTIAGSRVRERVRSQDARLPWVLLAELTDAPSGFSRGYVVWFEDERRRRSQGYYTSRLADARAEFERRAGFLASDENARARPRARRIRYLEPVRAGARRRRRSLPRGRAD